MCFIHLLDQGLVLYPRKAAHTNWHANTLAATHRRIENNNDDDDGPKKERKVKTFLKIMAKSTSTYFRMNKTRVTQSKMSFRLIFYSIFFRFAFSFSPSFSLGRTLCDFSLGHSCWQQSAFTHLLNPSTVVSDLIKL